MFSFTIGLNLKDSKECTLVLTVQLFYGCDLALVIPISPSPRCLLPKDSEEFKRLVEYVKNTHRATHTMYELEVMEIFKVARHGEEERFKSSLLTQQTALLVQLQHHQLLWYYLTGGWVWLMGGAGWLCCIYMRSWFN